MSEVDDRHATELIDRALSETELPSYGERIAGALERIGIALEIIAEATYKFKDADGLSVKRAFRVRQ